MKSSHRAFMQAHLSIGDTTFKPRLQNTQTRQGKNEKATLINLTMLGVSKICSPPPPDRGRVVHQVRVGSTLHVSEALHGSTADDIKHTPANPWQTYPGIEGGEAERNATSLALTLVLTTPSATFCIKNTSHKRGC